MNIATAEMLKKVESELTEAKKMMKFSDPFGEIRPTQSSIQYSHWKRIALDLMKERRAIKTGMRAW